MSTCASMWRPVVVLLAATLFGAAPSRPSKSEEKLDFFTDDNVSFDGGKDAAPPPATSPQPAVPVQQEPPPAVMVEEEEAPQSQAYMQPALPQAAPPAPPVRPASPRTSTTARHTPAPGPLANAPQRGSAPPASSAPVKRLGVDEVRVLQIRPLTELERRNMQKSLRCDDPLAAEILTTGRLKSLIADAMGTVADRIPDRLFWIFSPTTQCFQRPSLGAGLELSRVDDAARRALAKKGK